MAKVITLLARLFTGDPSEDEEARQRVYRADSIDGFRDPWLRSIVELGDGRTAGEIAQALYRRELHRGAGLVDIGAWKSLFDDSVFRSIGHLVYQGYLRIEPGRSGSPVEKAGTGSKDSNGDSGTRYTHRPFVQRGLAAPEKPKINAAGRPEVGRKRLSQRHLVNGVSPVSGPAGNRASLAELQVQKSECEGEADASQGMRSSNPTALVESTRLRPGPRPLSFFTAEIPIGLKELTQAGICAVKDIWKRIAGPSRR